MAAYIMLLVQSNYGWIEDIADARHKGGTAWMVGAALWHREWVGYGALDGDVYKRQSMASSTSL